MALVNVSFSALASLFLATWNTPAMAGLPSEEICAGSLEEEAFDPEECEFFQSLIS